MQTERFIASKRKPLHLLSRLVGALIVPREEVEKFNGYGVHV